VFRLAACEKATDVTEDGLAIALCAKVVKSNEWQTRSGGTAGC